MAREIVLDTETTGFDPNTGDRLIEVGCIEIDDLLPTGRTFHRFVNPERLIPPDAIRVHGITDDKVKDAPKFKDIIEDLMAFIGDAPLIAHNANFDRAFIDFELRNSGAPITGEARWIDTLKLAQARFPGMTNSLDALCKRFKISLAERTLHGALIDARLLAEVYLELKGGKERVLDLSGQKHHSAGERPTKAGAGRPQRPVALALRSSEAERERHRQFLAATLKDRSLWLAYGLEALTDGADQPGQ
jgi:DNA polymerase-3 subunit epsilon